MTPVLALITDFGTTGPYVAAMKGVILDICPEVTLVDITHEIAPQAVLDAALTLEASHCWFPAGTVFVAVVDPGVGTPRRAVAVRASGRYFVGPDNGLLTGVLRHDADARAVLLSNPAYWRVPVSATFEGRDRFGPVGAWLCRGVALDSLGPPAADLHRLAWPTSLRRGDVLEGRVLHADRFGNLLTSIDQLALATLCGERTGDVNVHVDGVEERLPLVRTYGELEPAQLGALVGSSGWLELCVRDGSAATRLGAAPPGRVRVSVVSSA